MATQDARSVHLKTPLGQDVLLPRMIIGSERISDPFRFDMNLLSERGDINPDDLLGKDVTVTYELPTGGGKRYLHGIVTELAQLGYRSRYHEYQAIVRPWFWQLSRTADCRIFQQKSVPDIFEEVVRQYGFTDYKLKLSGTYQKWDYCVQYRETDFNFLSRLLEQEGIYYFFEHSESAHLMVLADDAGAHQTVSGYDSVPFFSADAPDAQRERDHISGVGVYQSMRRARTRQPITNFENPRQSLLAPKQSRANMRSQISRCSISRPKLLFFHRRIWPRRQSSHSRIAGCLHGGAWTRQRSRSCDGPSLQAHAISASRFEYRVRHYRDQFFHFRRCLRCRWRQR